MATVRIQLRRGTSDQWFGANPTLAAGEIGIETDTNTFKFGDGITAWNDLSYALSDTVDDYIPINLKGVANGVAELDSNGYVPAAQLPPLAKVTVNAVADQAARLALTVEPGDIAIQADNGTTYVLQSSPASNNANWKEISATAAISAAVSAHESDTTNVHGIANTADLATKSYADQAEADAIATAAADATTKANAAQAAAELTAAADATTKANAAQAAAELTAANALSAHHDDTTDVHGIADTENLATLDGAQFLSNKTLVSPVTTGTLDAENITVSGNLTVNGTTTTVNTADLDVTDKNISLNVVETPTDILADGGGITLKGTTDKTFTYVQAGESWRSSENINIPSGKVYKIAGDEVLSSTQVLGKSLPSGDVVGSSDAQTLTNKTILSPIGIEKADVGLGNVDNTSDLDKPISQAVTYALDAKANVSDLALKADLEDPTFTGTVTLPATTFIGTVTGTEIAALAGVTLGIQSQIDAKADSDSPTLTGTVTLPATTFIGTVTGTEIAALAGVTLGIQSQIDAKADSDSPTLTGTVTLPATTFIGTVTGTEIAALAGVTDSIQNQLDARITSASAESIYAPKESPTFTGSVVLPQTVTIGNISSDELSTLNGVTSAIQAQIDSKANSENPVFTGTIGLPDGSITSAMIANGTIVAADIADGAITSDKIQNGAILNADISASAAIEQSKIANLTSDLALKAPLEGPTFTGTVTLPSTTSVGNVSSTELGYLDGVTSAIQTQLNNKASVSALSTHESDTSTHGVGTIVGTTETQTLTNKTISSANNTITVQVANVSDLTATASELNVLDGITASTAELNILDGVTATASELNVLDGITASTTELNYVDGVTSSIQTQLDSKASLSGATFTGDVTVETDLIVDGNLTVTGTTTTVNATDLVVSDPLIYIGEGNTANLVDLGLVSSYNDGTYQHAGIVRDSSEGKWKLFKGVTDEPTTTINFAQGSLDALAVGAFEASSATIGDVSNTELQYLNGVTSAIQTQIDTKAPSAGPTFTGTVTLPSTTSIGNVSSTELGYLDGVTSSVQTQLDSKALKASPTFTGTVTVAADGIAFTDGTQTKEGVPSRTTIYGAHNSNAITSNTTLSTLAYRDSLLEVSSSSDVVLTVPTNTTAAFPVGASFDIVRMGTGNVTVQAVDGTVIVNSTPGNKLRAQYSSATLFKRGTNSWLLIGDLSA